jgi:hypothetical protein
MKQMQIQSVRKLRGSSLREQVKDLTNRDILYGKSAPCLNVQPLQYQ